MILDLDRNDLEFLVRGFEKYLGPETSENLILSKYGSYTGGFVDQWKFHYLGQLRHATQKELYEAYLECKRITGYNYER